MAISRRAGLSVADATSRGATAAPRVCIVTPGYISSTPRVVREADTLYAAGYDVRVVFTQGSLEGVRQFDHDLLRARSWRWLAFGWSKWQRTERWAHFLSGVRHRAAQALPEATWRVAGVAERAEGRIFPELAQAAAAEPADLYIGHYPPGLAAAAYAAHRHSARVGYDVEDLYADTEPLTPTWSKTRARIVQLEQRYVHQCAHVSVASEGIGNAFARRYTTVPPVLIHNCHAWAERQQIDGRRLDRQGQHLSLYWYSQTIGLDRGIQDAIQAAGLLRTSVQIHLRGVVRDEVRRELTRLAGSCGVASSLYFHEPVPPHSLLSRADEHDVGLALEIPTCLNRRLAVTNKLLLYLTAGLAVVATNVPGQRSVIESCSAAGVLYEPGDVKTLALHLEAWMRDPAALARAKRAALDAARTDWNWELEGQKVADTIGRVLSRREGLVA